MSAQQTNCGAYSFCKERFDRQDDLLQQIDEAIRGNGKEGLTMRVARLEAFQSRLSRLAWLMVAAVFTSFGSLAVQLIILLVQHGSKP